MTEEKVCLPDGHVARLVYGTDRERGRKRGYAASKKRGSRLRLDIAATRSLPTWKRSPFSVRFGCVGEQAAPALRALTCHPGRRTGHLDPSAATTGSLSCASRPPGARRDKKHTDLRRTGHCRSHQRRLSAKDGGERRAVIIDEPTTGSSRRSSGLASGLECIPVRYEHAGVDIVRKKRLIACVVLCAPVLITLPSP